jgi:K+-sensing histidine kinase KdpD
MSRHAATPASMRARLLSLLLRPTAPSLALGLVVAASLIAVESVLVCVLKQVAPGSAFGVIYLLGVALISTVWGFGVALATSVASAIAFDYFRNWPATFIPTQAQNVAVIAVFVVVALVANTLAYMARTRAVETDQRHREAERARGLAELQASLRRVATLVAWGVSPPEVFSAVATELATVLRLRNAAVFRYEPGGAAALLAAHGEPDLTKTPARRTHFTQG